jgi:hypothetical protein
MTIAVVIARESGQSSNARRLRIRAYRGETEYWMPAFAGMTRQ